MRMMRTLIRDHRRFAVLLVALALCMKMMVPSGFMVGAAGKSLAITICDGQGAALTKQISLPPAGSSHDKSDEQGKASDACPYAGLGMAALSATPVALLAAALAFIFLRAVWPTARPRPAPRFFLRPPLRAPPFGG